jgi:hypothetical protein
MLAVQSGAAVVIPATVPWLCCGWLPRRPILLCHRTWLVGHGRRTSIVYLFAVFWIVTYATNRPAE